MTSVTLATLRLDGSYKLTIRFGTQSRTKCAGCSKYFVASDVVGAESTCGCGAVYTLQPSGRFKVVKLP